MMLRRILFPFLQDTHSYSHKPGSIFW